MQRTGRRQGIFLITTLFVVMFLTIMGTAVMSEILQGNVSSGSFSNRELALQAAESGLTYLQARLESNSASLAPPPDGAPLNPVSPFNTDILLTGCEIHELGYNVVGLLTDQNVESTAGQMRIMFRASFNKSYATLTTDANWPSVAAGLPSLPYVSASGLRQAPGGLAGGTYSNGVLLHAVMPQMADVLVQGLVVRTDGRILASRMIEGVFKTNDVGGMGDTPVNAAGDVNLFLNGAPGASSVTIGQQNYSGANGAPHGIGTQGNINLIGPDPVAGATPPDYSNSGNKALLTNTSTRSFTYGQGSMSVNNNASITWTGMPTNFSSNASLVEQVPNYTPPSIVQLPALSPAAANVSAGTYVVYNNQFYHFPVAFQASNPDGTPMTAEQQPITVVAGVPNYNGLAPDGPPTASLESTGATTFNTSTSVLQVNKDVAVQPIASGTSTIASIGIVEAPYNLQGSGASTAVELSLGPSASGGTVQVRAADAISLVGDVVGTGALVIGPVGATPATVSTTSNITVTGNSTVSSASSNGVALYSTNNINLAGIDPYQSVAGDPIPLPEPSGSASGGPCGPGPGSGSGGGTGTSYNESFTGLVYAYNNFNVYNGNQLTLTGALVTYGGNPSNPASQQTDQHDTGSVDVQASSMSFVFDPTRLGIFANFFGGQLTLSPQAVTLF